MTSRQSPEKFTLGRIHMGACNGEGSIFADREGRTRMEHGTTLYPIAHVGRGWDHDEDQANERRLVAAWNVFDGVPTSTIEQIAATSSDLRLTTSIAQAVIAATEIKMTPAHERLVQLLELVERAGTLQDGFNADDWRELRDVAADCREKLRASPFVVVPVPVACTS